MVRASLQRLCGDGPGEDEALEGLSEKAATLLQAGNSVHSQLKLTRREKKCFPGLMKSLANKEIGRDLNLSSDP